MNSAVSSPHDNKVKPELPFMNHTLQCFGYFGKLTQAEDTRIEQDRLLSEHTAIQQIAQDKSVLS